MLNQIYSDLTEREMLRSGDERRYQELASYLARRIGELPGELEANREGPYAGGCEYPYVLCGNYCAYPEECYICEPGENPGEEPVPVDGGVEGEPAGDEPNDDQGGFGGAGGELAGEGGAAGGAMAGAAGDGDAVRDIVIGPGFPGDIPPPGAGGGACLPPIEIYDPPIFGNPF